MADYYLTSFVKDISTLVDVPLRGSAIAALTSFAYNIGVFVLQNQPCSSVSTTVMRSKNCNIRSGDGAKQICFGGVIAKRLRLPD
ncbi:MAG: lysozyme [Synechococcales cyanobacterium CRU_2_2]|nr:lysozyme [Synechococcales cyanobacterium CRU_2_2]